MVWTAVPADAGETATTASIGPGLTAFLIVVGLFVATFFLARSMVHQIKKVPPTFDLPTDTVTSSDDDGDAEAPSVASADAEPDDAR